MPERAYGSLVMVPMDGEHAGLLSAYGGWQGRTRREHRAQVLARLGWRWCAAGEPKLLAEFLLARALEHDAAGVPALGLVLNCGVGAARGGRRSCPLTEAKRREGSGWCPCR